PSSRAAAPRASSSASLLSCGLSLIRPTQPPTRKPSSPAGSWITPSSVTLSLTTIFPILFSLVGVVGWPRRGGVGGENRRAARSSRSRIGSRLLGPGAGGRGRLGQLVRCFRRPAGEQEGQRQADAGQHGAGHEGGLVPRGQHEERVRAVVCGQVVLGAGDGH